MLNIFSWGYILFVIAVVAIYWIAVPRKARPAFLMLAGLGLILYQPPKFIILTGVYLVITWYFGHLIHSAKEQSSKKFLLISGIALSVGLLTYFKFGVFGDVHSLSITGSKGGTMSALGPLGISYFVFRVIHYLVEIYRGKFPQAGLWDFLLYVTFFPTVLAGPIEHFDRFQPQRVANKLFCSDDFYYGMGRIVVGLFKKLVISATLYQMITPYYMAVGVGGSTTLSTGQLWLIHNLYMLYLYMDFSGYSDIAIGTARLFGYKIMENFNYPLFKPNVGAFWANWHISLTQWLQKYVYFALGGNKKGFVKSAIFTFITMGLFGLWHGSGTSVAHYILFGFYHAMLIVIYRFWKTYRAKHFPNMKPSKIGYVISCIVTYEFICLGWPIFVHPLPKALTIWAKLLGMDVNVQLFIFQIIKSVGG